MEENRDIDIEEKNEEKFLIQMHSQAKMSGTKLPEVHGVRKELGPNLRPEKQHTMPKKGIMEKLHIGQGRAGLRRKHQSAFRCDKKNFRGIQIVTGKTNSPQHTNSTHDRGINNDKSFPPDVLLHCDPFAKATKCSQPN